MVQRTIWKFTFIALSDVKMWAIGGLKPIPRHL